VGSEPAPERGAGATGGTTLTGSVRLFGFLDH